MSHDFQRGFESEPDSAEYGFEPTKPRHTEATPPKLSPATGAAAKASAKQRSLGFDGEVIKETIIRKLTSIDRHDLAHPLLTCHTRQTVKLCNGCRKVSVFYNRCEVKYCPVCAKRLAQDKKKSVEWWTTHILQAKHVVLTVRNTETISAESVAHIKQAWTRLRRTVFATKTTSRPAETETEKQRGEKVWSQPWVGGFWSLEVTNEGRGWHVHIHALVNSRFIDSTRLAREWAKQVGQDFAIVKVKDVRDGDYLRELCKYIVDGNEMVRWSAQDIASYIDAVCAGKSWGCFGTLYKMRKEHRAFLDDIQADPLACACGCTDFRVFDENEWSWYEHLNGHPDKRQNIAPAPKAVAMLELSLF